MKNAIKNWKTTSAGIVMCVGAIITYINDKSKILECFTAFLGGIGLILAKDNDQTGISY